MSMDDDDPPTGDLYTIATEEIDRLRGWLRYIEKHHSAARQAATYALSGAPAPEMS